MNIQNNLLLDASDCIKVNRNLAVDIGLKEAIVFSVIKDLQKNKAFADGDSIRQECSFIENYTFRRIIKRLIDDEYIYKKKMNDDNKVMRLKCKNLSGHGIGSKECSWCHIRTTVLHEHHYPIPKREGGTKTVLICPNCHYEFHHPVNIYVVKS